MIEYASLNYPFDLTGISIQNGILTFSDTNYLFGLDAQLDSFNNNYNSDTTIICSFDTANIAFENQIGFNSLRKKIDNETTNLENDDNLWDYNDPDDHFIIDDFTRTILNQTLEYGINDRIYKYINEYTLVEFEYENTALLNKLREYDLEKSLVDTNLRLHSYYKGGDIVADFLANEQSQNTVSFINKSNNATSYYWDFGDGNTSTEAEPVHTYSTRDIPYQITLVAKTTKNGQKIYDRKIYNISAKGDCDVQFNYEIASDNYTDLNLYITFSTSEGTKKVTIKWGDGKPKTKTTVGDNEIDLYESHSYDGDGEYKVSVSVEYVNECTAKQSKTIKIGPNDDCYLRERNKDDAKYANNSRKIKYRFFIRNSPYHHRIKAKIKHYKIKSNGSLKRTRADVLEANYIGTFYESDECGNNSKSTDLPKYVEKKKRAVAKDVNRWGVNKTDKVRARNNEITAYFYAKDNGDDIYVSLKLQNN